MKLLVFLTIGTFIHFSVLGQLDQELTAWYKFGFSTNSFKSTLDHIDPAFSSPDVVWNEAKFLNESTINLEYKLKIWERFKLYGLVGVELGKSSYYIPIINSQGYQLGDINFNQKKAGYFFGIAKRFELYNSKVKVDIGYRIKDIYPFQKNVNFSQDWEFSEKRNWIEYKYSLDTYYRQRFQYTGKRSFYYTFLRGEPFISIEFSILDNWLLNIQTSYQRNNYFFYQYNYDVRYYLGGSSEPNSFESFFGSSSEFFKNNDLIYTSIGVTYRFPTKNAK